MKTIHKIILGDALKVLKTLPNESVDLIFADPPYNISKKRIGVEIQQAHNNAGAMGYV